MKLVFALKVMLLSQIRLRFMLSNQTNLKETKYSFNSKDCKLNATHFWKTNGEDLGACFKRCHHIDSCISVTYDRATFECLGYKSCIERCDGGPDSVAFMNYCQGGWYFEYM